MRPGPQPLSLHEWITRVEALIYPLDNGCHIWLGSRLPSGYGRVRVPPVLAERLGLRCRIARIHRALYVYITREPLPPKVPLEHRCGERPCIRFEHLEPTTQLENNRLAVLTRTQGLHGWDRFKEARHKDCLGTWAPASGDAFEELGAL